MHWAETYVGDPYVPGEHDCGAFAARVMREQFGREVHLPSARGHGLRDDSRQINRLLDDFGEPVDTPAESDAVVMVSRGMLSHVGIYCEINGEAHVVHAMKNAGQVCLHKLRQLEHLGLRIEGYYRWR